jgi:hypothetical protein
MRYQPGQSGNPSGRPRGISDSRVALREALQSRSEALLDHAINRALQGQDSVLIALLGRLLPPLKSEETYAPLPIDHGDPKELHVTAKQVLSAVCEGRLPITDGERLTTLLLSASKLILIDQLEARVAALEGGS